MILTITAVLSILTAATAAQARSTTFRLNQQPTPEASYAPALHLKPPSILKSGAQMVHVQAVFERNYPLFDVAFAHGLPGNLELTGHGLFHHQKVSGFGDEYRYDFDEFQAGLRWGGPQGNPTGPRTCFAGGVSKMYGRLKFSDGRYFFFKRRYLWANATTSVTGSKNSRLIIAMKGLHEQDTGNKIAATAGSLELAAVRGITLIGDMAWFIKNPAQWRRPWALGARRALGRHWLVFYVSNTWGTTAPDSLFGTQTKFYNVRLHMIF